MYPPPNGGELRAKTTLFVRSLGASGRMPESPVPYLRHMDVPAVAGGELRVKTTLFARSLGASGRMPESPFNMFFSELIADAELETPRHDEAAVRRQDRSRIALGQRILIRHVVAGELHDKRLVER